MNNALFGKLMEQLRQRVDCRIVTSPKQAKRLTAKATFASFKIINEDITIVKMRKTSIFWNKPIYCSLVVLDLSKLWMYQFYYRHIKHLCTAIGRSCYSPTLTVFVSALRRRMFTKTCVKMRSGTTCRIILAITQAIRLVTLKSSVNSKTR